VAWLLAENAFFAVAPKRDEVCNPVSNVFMMSKLNAVRWIICRVDSPRQSTAIATVLRQLDQSQRGKPQFVGCNKR